MSRRPKVLLAEPDAAIRFGIRLALEAADFEICAEPADASAAIVDAVETGAEVCLVAETIPGGANTAIAVIYRRLPGTKLLILTEGEEHATLFDAIRAGASGYLRKDLEPTRLPATIYGVLDGEAALSRRLTFQLMEQLRIRERGRTAPTKPGGPAVTDRELEVLELMTEGLTTSQMAARLEISDVTVRRHVSSAMTKLGVADRAAAIAVLSGKARVEPD